MSRTLQECRDSAIEEVRELEPIELTDPYVDDRVHEIVDGHVPIYNSTLLEIAAEDLDMALSEPELGPAFDGESTPINIIAANIYEYLCQEVGAELRDLIDEEEEMGWEHEEALEEYEVVCEVREIIDAAADDWYRNLS